MLNKRSAQQDAGVPRGQQLPAGYNYRILLHALLKSFHMVDQETFWIEYPLQQTIRYGLLWCGNIRKVDYLHT